MANNDYAPEKGFIFVVRSSLTPFIQVYDWETTLEHPLVAEGKYTYDKENNSFGKLSTKCLRKKIN